MSFICSTDPDEIEEILRGQVHPLVRKENFTSSRYGPSWGTALLTSDGETWRRQRAMSSSPLLPGRDRFSRYAATMVDDTKMNCSATWKPDQTCDIHSEMDEARRHESIKTLRSTLT